ncbi:hypothetical protein HDV62DRAFT_374653 [Trichoderma sp. SZMC 28011]
MWSAHGNPVSAFPRVCSCFFLTHSLTFPSRFASFCEKYGIGISASRCTAIEAPALRSRGLAAKEEAKHIHVTVTGGNWARDLI